MRAGCRSGVATASLRAVRSRAPRAHARIGGQPFEETRMTRNAHRLLAAALALLPALALAATDAPPPSLEQEIAKRDREFFDSFNTCDQPGKLEEHAAWLDPKLEFYHDLGGVSWTAEAYLEGVRNNVCGKFARELVPGSMKVFPLKDFGALSTGTHRFCHYDSGRCEGEAEFAIVWKADAERNGWTVTRVLSYAHRELPDKPLPLPSTPKHAATPTGGAGAVVTEATQASAKVDLDAPPMRPKPDYTRCFGDEAEIGYCRALRVGDTLYVSGVVGKGAMPQAVASVYARLAATLRQQGLGFEHVVKENVYTLDLDAFEAANGERKKFYAGTQPAATWVQVQRLFRPEYVLEVELVATVPPMEEEQ
jgi:enamine deaminase RidA (YjgF/YER057c/UK114 family)